MVIWFFGRPRRVASASGEDGQGDAQCGLGGQEGVGKHQRGHLFGRHCCCRLLTRRSLTPWPANSAGSSCDVCTKAYSSNFLVWCAFWRERKTHHKTNPAREKFIQFSTFTMSAARQAARQAAREADPAMELKKQLKIKTGTFTRYRVATVADVGSPPID